MNLANKIIELRTENKLSQSDLAEKLGVSRQSISKWETGTSTPDLEHLVLLSELFAISLDDLVKNQSQANTPQTQAPPHDKQSTKQSAQAETSTRKIIGFILLGIGLFSAVISLLLGFILVVPGILLITTGIICLKTNTHIGLKIAWLWFIAILMILTPAITGANLGMIFNPFTYQNGFSIHLIITFIIWFFYVLLSIKTIMIFKNTKSKLLALCWCISAYFLQGILSTAQVIIYTDYTLLPTISIASSVFYVVFIIAIIIATIIFNKKR